jgi:hypothetical protein
MRRRPGTREHRVPERRKTLTALSGTVQSYDGTSARETETMSIRAATLAFGVSFLLIAGCPSEKKEAEDDGNSGNGGDSGEGGAGEGGTSGESGTSGTGGEEVPDLPAEEAAAGMCEMVDETEGCTGLEAYQECINTECNFDECYAGPCATFLDCLSDADSPCGAVQDGTCERSQECTDCFMADANCLINCYEHVDCGGGMAGTGGDSGAGGEAGTGGLPEGTCADLDACCATLADEEAMACTLVADSAREQGDLACAVYVDAFCP